MKKILFSAAIVLAVIVFAVAAAMDGKWTGKYDGQYDVTLTLKTTGKVVTGTMKVADNNPVSENPGESEYSPFIAATIGENAIIDGKMNGEELTFSTKFNDTVIPYTAKIDGEKLVLTATFKGTPVKTGLRKSN
ncbi:MAG TPA: hypothetical protein VFE57_05530 [Cyclobacteriaceae bacterium]|jgi:hypothetical protein|nr:hypothetical protein [Cyclobacteriaceae bacterium]